MYTSHLSALDARFPELSRAIPALREAELPHHPEEGNGAHAAVSLILRAREELEILLIRRAEAEGDPWSGHMALPGGRRDRNDGSLLRTALRETFEETGIDLEEAGTPLGKLEALEPAAFRRPPLSIFPFVFGVSGETRARVASPEVEEVLWSPLSLLESGEASGTVEIPLGDIHKTFPCLRIEGRVVWGLTYRILQDFLGRIRERAPGILTEGRSPS